jgi:hypothetical protein
MAITPDTKKSNIIVNHFLKEDLEPKIISGIDTLYYFAESNEAYDDFYLNMIEELDIQKEKGSYSFGKNNAPQIEINGIRLNYTGQPEGYHYFKDEMEFVYIGFKDSFKQRNLHDIRVRVQARGIYTLGLKSLLEYVDSIVKNISNGKKHITRIDVNAFVDVNFTKLYGFMFATKKRFASAIINDIRGLNALETLYIGKPPFRLRIYDKLKEMQKSKKSELMQEYLYSNGMEKDKPIWNIEFEMHRDFLKQFNILSVDDAIGNAEKLFKQACDYVRLVNIFELSESDIENGHKNRASTLPIWQKIQEGYTLKDFMQITAPLERVKRRVKKYEYADAFTEAVVLAWKMRVNGYEINDEFVKEVKEELEKKRGYKEELIQSKIFDLEDLKNKISMASFAALKDHELKSEQYLLMKMFINEEPNNDLALKVHFATQEMEKRGLIEKAEEMF